MTKVSPYDIIIVSKGKESGVITMTVKELRAVLKLAKNENAEIGFSTEPGVAFGVNDFEDDGENFWILLDTREWLLENS